jgi:hypothetical protein
MMGVPLPFNAFKRLPYPQFFSRDSKEDDNLRQPEKAAGTTD